MIRHALTVVPALLLAGCSTSVPGCGSPPDLTATWSYSGKQEGASPASLSGTMTLGKTGTCTISGTLSLTIDDGTPETTAWTVSGDFLDDSIVEFDATQSGAARHHLGTVRADSIVGGWHLSANTSGDFKLVRGAP